MDLDKWAAKWSISVNALISLKQEMRSGEGSVDIARTLPMSETAVTRQIRLDAAKQGIMLWRNNVGAFVDDNDNFIRYGLANDSAAMNKRIKSSDLIGIKPNGQFIAREVKRPGWHYTGTAREKAQQRFIDLVLAHGGDAAFTTGGESL